MILPDVNVLVYAFRREAEHHERYADWLARLVAGADELALHDTVLAAVARVVTHPKIFADPAPCQWFSTFSPGSGRHDEPTGCHRER